MSKTVLVGEWLDSSRISTAGTGMCFIITSTISNLFFIFFLCRSRENIFPLLYQTCRFSVT